jgi:lysophospholipase L1-like esterase
MAAPGGRLTRIVIPMLMVVGAVTAAGVVAEAALRLGRFHYQPFPEVQFGWPEPQVIVNDFRPDSDLQWVTRDYYQRLDDARRTHPAVIFLGDSCVEFSHYPRLAMDRVRAADPAIGSATKLSVPGWSTEQGRRQFDRDVASLRPKVVVIEFGWNDHWDALGPPDRDAQRSAAAVWAAEHFRIYQAYAKASDGLAARQHPEPSRRVPLAEYRENLETIVRHARDIGARVVLVTAPSAHQAGHEPSYLQVRHLKHLTTLVPLHASYVQATRDVAVATGAGLCDAAAAANEMGERRRTLFRHDGIHFTDAGDRFMAATISPCMLRAAGH